MIDALLKALSDIGTPVSSNLLREAQKPENAALLAPTVVALAEKAARGVWLLPGQQEILLFGLHILAAARQTQAFPALIALLARPEDELDNLFGDTLGLTGPGLIMGLFDGDPAPLYSLMSDPGAYVYARLETFKAMARMAWEGRIERSEFIAFLSRFDREDLAVSGNMTWIGWTDAVCHLGLAEFEDRVKAVWSDERIDAVLRRDVDLQENLRILRHAAENPLDSSMFDQDRIVAITDVAEALIWLEPRAPRKRDPKDAAADIALTDREIDWLACFLDNRLQPRQTMSIEMLDGFLAALAVPPDSLKPDEYLPLIWGNAGEQPVFEDSEYETYVIGLIRRHAGAVAARIAARQEHAPILWDGLKRRRGVDWSEGFSLGVTLHQEQWLPVMRDRLLSKTLVTIADIAESFHNPGSRSMSDGEREAALYLLPAAPSLFANGIELGPLIEEPVRSTKVGRNDPCPCGSGRKYKKCHGGPDAPPFH